MTSMAHPDAPQLTIGVDTHLDLHVAHANDQLGRPVATIQIPTTPAGYQQLLAWAHELGEPIVWGVEGTGCYGAALARFLAANAQVVVEVNRTDRQARRLKGKSDPLDAQAAARAVQAGQARVVPKAGDGQVEMIRCLRVARATAMRARTQTINTLKGLLVTAPPSSANSSAAGRRPGWSRRPLPWSRARSPTRWPPPPLPLAAWPAAIRPCRPRSTPSAVSWTGSPRPRRPSWWPGSGSAMTAPAPCWWRPATTPTGSEARPRSRCCAAPHRSRRPRARRSAIASTGAVTVKPTPRCTGSWSSDCATTSQPGTT
jgi:Transposase